MSVLRVLLATTWEEPCGIAEHSAYLKESVEAADPAIAVTPIREALNPGAENVRAAVPRYFDVLHLNYQRALHSRWDVEAVRRAKASEAYRAVVVTFHDTFGELPADQLSYDLCRTADAFIVHEPCEGLGAQPSWTGSGQAIYWRMGVPPPRPPMQFGWGSGLTLSTFKGWAAQPVLGTVGFPFPWKNYEWLCEISREAGWALLLIAPRATTEQITHWRTLQPDLCVLAQFETRDEVVSLLTGCDATAFCYTCANSGQSGAVLQGIAARKPAFAFKTCRQNRALLQADGGAGLLRWGETFDDLRQFLRFCPIARVDARTVALAERDSWAKLGRQYAELYRRVAP